jgi:hypothetical protein
MSYVSKAQQGYFNSNRKKLGNALVDEFNSASKGQKNLPEHVKADEDADDMPVRQAKVRRLNAMTRVYPEKKKTEDVDLGNKGSFTVHKGALHSMLGIPQDETIPKAREESAAHQSKNPLLKRRAISALGFRGMNHG